MADGDIRVLLVLDVVLSAAFVALVLYLAAFGGLVAFTPVNVALGTAAVAALTYLVVLR
jgi:hypothetical protein